jgi:hypothetical protein
MEFVALGGTLLSAGMTIAGGFQQANQADAAAKQAQINAKAEASESRLKTDDVRAKQRAIAGASGVQSIGSPLEVMLESAKEAELEAQKYIYKGKVEANSYKAQASNLRTGAIMGGVSGLAGGLLKPTAGGSKYGLLGELYDKWGK